MIKPAQSVQENFYSPVNYGGRILWIGRPRAFQFAARVEF